ncbi:unnamed protein product [Schistocephalus solidus]|uniref:FYVE-type domain-containing protein n=1 Tax=Schistocephalus solidus TaxID=70667 RepID=A0A183SM01_SCHSO|nr:unnamed protein product [Schistocephalus solidus]
MSDVTEVQGFLCPECMLSLGSSEELMVHFNSKHASETDQLPSEPVSGLVMETGTVSEIPNDLVYVCHIHDLASHLQVPEYHRKVVTELIKDYDQLVLGCFTQNKQLDEEVKRTSAKVTLLESVLRSLLEDTISTTTVANLEEDLRSKVTDFLERRTCAQTAQEAAFDQAVSDKNQALELVHLLEGKLNADSRVLELEAQLQEQMQGQQQAQSLDPQLSMRMDGLQLDPVEADPSPKVWHLSRPPNSSRKNPPGQLDFEHKLSQLSEQLESSQKERNLLSEKVASLQNEVSKANNYLTEQAYNAQHLEQEKAQLQSALSAAESSTSALLAQHEKEILQLKSVSEENEKHLTGQLHHLQLQLKESSDELSRLRASIADLNSRNASSAAEVSQLANRLSEASSKLETSEASLASAMQEVGDLRQQLEIAKQTAQSSEYISESLRKEVAKLEGLLREQREETDGLNNQLDLLRSEKTALEEFKSKQTFEIWPHTPDTVNGASDLADVLPEARSVAFTYQTPPPSASTSRQAELRTCRAGFPSTNDKISAAGVYCQYIHSRVRGPAACYLMLMVVPLVLVIASWWSAIEMGQGAVLSSLYTMGWNDLKTEITRLLGCETSLKESLAQESSRLAQLEAECQKLRDAEGSALSGLQTKLDSTLLEHQTLMDQFIAVQDKNGQLEAALGTCHQELESLQRIVLDLGRQNQTLQIAQQRMTSRQWVADESASACSNCQREFSLSLRKHHCRRCGDVFCQTCSTKKATMPASKSPLRVCDACFTELTGSK